MEKEVSILFSLLSVVQDDLLGLPVLVDRLSHHLVDGTVVVDVLVGGFSVLEDVVVVSVVNDQNAPWLQHVVEVLDGNLLVPREII